MDGLGCEMLINVWEMYWDQDLAGYYVLFYLQFSLCVGVQSGTPGLSSSRRGAQSCCPAVSGDRVCSPRENHLGALRTVCLFQRGRLHHYFTFRSRY